MGYEDGQVRVYSVSLSLSWGSEFTLASSLATEVPRTSSFPGTLTLHTHSPHSLFTLTLHAHSPRSLSTLTLHAHSPHSPHSLSTLTLHAHSPHSLSTLSTLTLHTHSPHSPQHSLLGQVYYDQRVHCRFLSLVIRVIADGPLQLKTQHYKMSCT